MNQRFIGSCVAIMLTLLSGCGGGEVTPPAFDGTRAFGYLSAQVAFGPRVPGTPPSVAARQFYVDHFRATGMAVDSQRVAFRDPYSADTIPLVNLIAHFAGTGGSTDRVFLAAHYDCRPRTDYAVDSTAQARPIDGANDGASGVAVLMELANMFKEQPPEADVDLVLLDGEDWGKSGDLDYYSLGAKALARSLDKSRYRFGIVLDLVGDKDQQIGREGYSEEFSKPLNDLVWSIAQRLDVSTFLDTVRHSVIDDHLPFNVVGIPTIDLIDFDYEFWHTEFDTPDKCSSEALANVGKVVAHIVYNRLLWPKN